jgi:hypothetical protein
MPVMTKPPPDNTDYIRKLVAAAPRFTHAQIEHLRMLINQASEQCDMAAGVHVTPHRGCILR